jgi:hypothetical protein
MCNVLTSTDSETCEYVGLTRNILEARDDIRKIFKLFAQCISGSY